MWAGRRPRGSSYCAPGCRRSQRSGSVPDHPVQMAPQHLTEALVLVVSCRPIGREAGRTLLKVPKLHDVALEMVVRAGAEVGAVILARRGSEAPLLPQCATPRPPSFPQSQRSQLLGRVPGTSSSASIASGNTREKASNNIGSADCGGSCALETMRSCWSRRYLLIASPAGWPDLQRPEFGSGTEGTVPRFVTPCFGVPTGLEGPPQMIRSAFWCPRPSLPSG